MPFKLRVTFTGMCLFVPEPAKNCLHVLLLAPDEPPMVGRTASMKMERHFPRLFYNAAHDQPGTTDLSTDYRCISLEDKELDLTSVPGLRSSLTPPASVADLTPFVSELEQTWIQADAPPKIAGHVILPATSASAPPACVSGPWSLGGDVQMDAYRVAWDLDSIALDQYQLEWELAGLRGTGDEPLVPLHELQMPFGPGIELRVKNVVRSESTYGNPPIPPAPIAHTAAPHFAAYYDLFGKPGPDLTFEPNHPSAAAVLGAGDPQLCGGALGDLFTCMLAQATLQGA